jgi:hypothetical protein
MPRKIKVLEGIFGFVDYGHRVKMRPISIMSAMGTIGVWNSRNEARRIRRMQ